MEVVRNRKGKVLRFNGAKAEGPSTAKLTEERDRLAEENRVLREKVKSLEEELSQERKDSKKLRAMVKSGDESSTQTGKAASRKQT